MINVERYPGSQTAVGRIIRTPLRLIPKRVVVPILQGPLRGKRWITGSGIHRIWLGSYEVSKMALAAAWVQAGDTVFDIGANVGIYTLLFSERVGSEGRVVAFEPSARNVSYLRRHLWLNGATNVSVVEAAVSATTGIARFEPGDDASTGRLDVSGMFEVATTAIDAFVEFSAQVPSLLKIDVEGAEVDVLHGALATLNRLHPRILLATHSKTLKQTCVRLLASSEYDVRELEDDAGVPQPDELIASASPSASESKNSP